MASPIDRIYEQIFGELPAKAGTAFEMLAAIATFLMDPGEVRHDARVRGEISRSMYQLDVHHIAGQEQTMGEAKDYSLIGGKVGRDDLQKLGGALGDLSNIDRAHFWSATGYTKPAIQYANAAEQMFGKPIKLFGLRPSTELDERGFIKTIVLRGTYQIAQHESAQWTAHWTDEGIARLRELIAPGADSLQIEEKTDTLFDESGDPVMSIFELTSRGYGDIHEDGNSYGCFWLTGLFSKICGLLIRLKGFEYRIPYVTYIKTVKITDDSASRFVVMDDEGNPIRMLRDEILRQFNFDTDGNLLPPAPLQHLVPRS
ncbi:hypothetical protein R69619_03707 [Paraburkholderia nemoris]|uniref:restriction endonuclease n=1 Tax=Paraburkholderia nemoris TaxID=2793076 RepID=UPI001909A81B|nr:restriction endonuclease [Paraburkholderia nemoris]MBK3744185.1 restriction endonuclease [Paraburkholderia aspalathi]CAE6768020.1 hypothetical protein R69619_03707 [Paraburkholderia nemoris]